jgi:hypothetical protein
MSAFIDLTDLSFDSWTVLCRAPNRGRDTRWTCQCVCGTVRDVYAGHLRSGKSTGCGCLADIRTRQRFHTHGMGKTPEYSVWINMKGRCYDLKDKGFINYGGRGITVCEAWRYSFEAFYKDMGPRPSASHTIERRNNNSGYSKENCYWATRLEQARNKRNNHYINLDGMTKCLMEWLAIKHMGASTYITRINRGWSIEKALTTPPAPRRVFKKYRKPI